MIVICVNVRFPYLGRLIRELGTFMDELSAGKVPEMIKGYATEGERNACS